MSKQSLRDKARAAKPLVSVFMPARNEEPTIARNVEVLKQGIARGQIDHAVLVIDGSSDGTPQIIYDSLGVDGNTRARLDSAGKKPAIHLLGNGVILLRNREPLGKGTAFVQAVFALKKMTRHFSSHNSVLVNVDADAVNLSGEVVRKLADELLERKVPMLVGTHLEETRSGFGVPEKAHPDYAGFRALSALSLKGLLEKKPEWVRTMPSKLCIEPALNLLICRDRATGKRTEIPQSQVSLMHLPPGRHYGLLEQNLDRRLVYQRFKEPKFILANMRVSSGDGDYSWADQLAFKQHLLKKAVRALKPRKKSLRASDED